MPVSFHKSELRPVVVNEEFFHRCQRLFAEVLAVNRKEIIDKHGLSTMEFEQLVSGDAIDEDAENYANLLNARYDIRKLQTEYSLNFVDGTTITSDNLDEIIDELRRSPSRCKKLSAKSGSYADIYVKIEIEDTDWKSTRCDINGDAPSVNHLKAIALPIIEDSTPTHKYLRGWPFWGFVSVLIFFFLEALVFFILKRMVERDVIDIAFAAGLFFTSLIVTSPAAVAISRRSKRHFPIVEFHFGSQMRNIGGVRELYIFLITIVLIPIVIAVLISIYFT